MTDVVPDNSNRIAFLIGQVFHPAVIPVPTLILVLDNLAFPDLIGWTTLVAVIVLIPGLLTMAYLRQRERYAYQQRTRGPIYVVVWLSIVFCLLVVLGLGGPQELAVCIATLAVWIPAQLFVNTAFTKISTHVAVAAGCATGLLVLGKLDTTLAQIVAVLVVVLTSWARVTTKNHTLLQVVLGFVVGAGSVLLMFPLFLG